MGGTKMSLLRWGPGSLVLSLTCAIGSAAPVASPAPVRIEVKKGEEIVFHLGSELVTRYHITPAVAKPYFWPLNAPGEVPVTRAWPMEKPIPGEQTDHVHQKSAWFCHGDVIPEGLELKHHIKGVDGVDFWSETPGHGKIVCVAVDAPKEENGHASITTRNEWRTADNQKVLQETRTLSLYNLDEGRLLVVDIDLQATEVPIVFGDTKEGAFGVRVQTSMTLEKGKGQITNAEGKKGEGRLSNVEKKGCWGLLSAWCDYSGDVAGTTAGIAVFADPSNPYPTAWHSRGYGLMAANPFGRNKAGFPDLRGKTDLVRLAKGDHLKLRYGIFLHTGDVDTGKVATAYERFVKRK
jgi:hypothetical protein